jgi:chorismate synthase
LQTGKGKWFKGTIRYAHRDGTYDIKYADGDTEQGVVTKCIRRLSTDKVNSSSPKKSSLQQLDSETEAVLFEAGDEIEARFGGRARFFKGTRAHTAVYSALL